MSRLTTPVRNTEFWNSRGDTNKTETVSNEKVGRRDVYTPSTDKIRPKDNVRTQEHSSTVKTTDKLLCPTNQN